MKRIVVRAKSETAYNLVIEIVKERAEEEPKAGITYTAFPSDNIVVAKIPSLGDLVLLETAGLIDIVQ